MSYVLVQNELTAPTPEQFRAAFRVIDGLTDADANKAAREGYGLLLRHLTAEDAAALHQAMAAQGVSTTVVEETELSRATEPKVTRRVEFSDLGLCVFDPLGRQAVVNWEHVLVIAAGLVPKVDMVKVESAETKIAVGGLTSVKNETIKTVGHKLQASHRSLLHILAEGGSMRVEIDMETLFYKYAMPDAPEDASSHFSELVRRLALRAPQAGLNRGAAQLNNGDTFPLPYASKAAFADECIWLLWLAGRQGQAS
jgi:hypothetical protein